MYKTLDLIRPEIVRRACTGIPELDWLYGSTEFSNGEVVWGIPQKAITLLSGESGSGKSRLLATLAASLANRGFKILYAQTEYTVSQMADRIRGAGVRRKENFAILDKRNLFDITAAAIHFRPQFIFIDSVNELDDYRSGSKRDIKNIIDGYESQIGLRGLCQKLCCHIVLVSQLNQDGSIKGSTTLPHLVDIALNLHKTQCEGLVALAVGVKHRYGRTGKNFFSFWSHTDKGLVCSSNYRNEDPKWMKTKYGI
jgi:predicted ATP-dependent serine protease